VTVANVSNIVDAVEVGRTILLVEILLVRTDNLQWVVREEYGTVHAETMPQLDNPNNIA
jgi:hypothetical protein